MNAADTAHLTHVQAGMRGYLAKKHLREDMAQKLQARGMDRTCAEMTAEAVVEEQRGDPKNAEISMNAADTAHLTHVLAGMRGYLTRKHMREDMAQKLEARGMDRTTAEMTAEAVVEEQRGDPKSAEISMNAADTAHLTHVQAGMRGYLT